MGTTSKMSIPYPENNDFVADGATNMKDIADQVDLRSGIVKIIPTVSGTGASVATNGEITFASSTDVYITCFSSSFKHYKVIGNLTAYSGGTQNFHARFANTGTPNTTAANYRYAGTDQTYAGAGPTLIRNDGASALFVLSRCDNATQFNAFTAEIINPFETALTAINSTYRDVVATGLTIGYLTVNTSYAQLNVRLNGTNTFSGSMSIYGYN